MRARRSCLAVPGSSPKMLTKAAGVPADEVFFDLEDSVIPADKEAARGNIIEALTQHAFTAPTKVLRVNGVYTRWCARDVLEVVEAGGEQLDCIMIPKVESAADVSFVANLLRMIEESRGLSKRLGIEVQIETALGLENLAEIAGASDRLEDLILGPVDMAASLGLPTTVPEPGGSLPQALTHVLMKLNVTARAHGLQCIDGPHVLIRDQEGLRLAAQLARGLGFDGKWALHPDQVPVLNEVFRPTQEEYDHAEALLEYLQRVATVESKGAAMFGREVVDEASRKMADQVAARGRASGMTRVKGIEEFIGSAS